MQGFCPLASGSKGNCIYFGSENTRLLIDAGISCSEIQKRLLHIGVDITTIDAVLITHEHTDHIKGLETLCSKYKIPVFANSETAMDIQKGLKKKLRFKIFTTGESFAFGDIEIHPFSIQHDAVDPVAFVFQAGRYKIGFCTDLGFVTSSVTQKLEGCHFLYVEANHQPSMVHACSRPDVYKQRVLSRQGHLSNEECADLLDKIFHEELKHVHLAHLSSECNHPEVAIKTVVDKLAQKNKKIEVSIAFQDKISQKIYFLETDFEAVISHADLAIHPAVL